MKKSILFISTILLLTGCGNPAAPKPKKLIDEKKMTDILYDVALLEGIRQRRPGTAAGPEFIYKKYGIDSLQFAKNNHYYASDIEKYERIYNAINDRLEHEKHVTDSLITAQGGKSTDAVPAASYTPVVK